jgi:undecaprenyl diphosphate synthase
MKPFTSSTREIPRASDIPRHIAVIMDGNGRWAKKRYLPRVAGHKQGVETVRQVTRACTDRGIEYLTLFAFSSENWRRPAEEVSTLKQLFMAALEQEAERLHQNKVRLKIIGDIEPFGARVVELAHRAQELTSRNAGLTLTIAANYGGRWDLMQALLKLVRSGRHSWRQWCAQLRARTGSVHSHRWRAAHQQFPALAACLHRTVLHADAVAGLRRQAARRGARLVSAARAPLRADQRAGRKTQARNRRPAEDRVRLSAVQAEKRGHPCSKPAC